MLHITNYAFSGLWFAVLFCMVSGFQQEAIKYFAFPDCCIAFGRQSGRVEGFLEV